jgi:hypothetical protein
MGVGRERPTIYNASNAAAPMIVRKIIVALFCAVVLLGVGLPMGLYWTGLANIEGRPRPIALTDIAADTALLQQKFRSPSPIVVRVINPWTFLGSLRPSAVKERDVGASAVWAIVRSYNSTHLRKREMTWWHLSGAALTIWVTRHWTPDQIVASAAAIARSWPPEPAPR